MLNHQLQNEEPFVPVNSASDSFCSRESKHFPDGGGLPHDAALQVGRGKPTLLNPVGPRVEPRKSSDDLNTLAAEKSTKRAPASSPPIETSEPPPKQCISSKKLHCRKEGGNQGTGLSDGRIREEGSGA